MRNKALISEYEKRLAQADALLQEKLKRDQDANLVLKEKENNLKVIEDQIAKKSVQLSEVEKPTEKTFSVLFDDSSAGVFREAELETVDTIPKEQFDTLTAILSGDSEDDVDDTDDLPGIYLVSPHAELVSAKKKTLIVKSRDFSNLCDKELILCSSGLAFGTLKMKLPREATHAELEELYPAHRITQEEIKEWWPNLKTFYLYDIYDVSIWDKPRHADIPQGVQTFIKNVKLVDSVEREEELSKKECSTCDLKVSSKECFNAHPGSTIALTKLANSLNVKAHIISNESKVIDDDADQDAKGYMESPSEDKKWLGMIQFDSRKKNVGIDFRWQVSGSMIAAFTVFVPKGLSKVPEDPADAKKILTKEILPLVKETMADPLKKFNCQPKKNISATKDVFKEMVGYGPGYDKKRFMWTVDSFEVEHGCKKPHYVELFCNNDFINGRIVFVKIPNKAEWEKTPEGDYTWMMFKTKTEIPYAISARAVEKKWIPPFGTSALPRRIRSKIPERFKYWKIKDTSRRREVRDELVEEMKKKLIKLNDAK